MVVVKKAY